MRIGEDRETVAHFGQRPETLAGFALMPIDRRLGAHDAPGLEAVAVAEEIEVGKVYLARAASALSSGNYIARSPILTGNSDGTQTPISVRWIETRLRPSEPKTTDNPA